MGLASWFWDRFVGIRAVRWGELLDWLSPSANELQQVETVLVQTVLLLVRDHRQGLGTRYCGPCCTLSLV